MRPRMKLRAVRVYTSKASGKTFLRHDLTIPAQAIQDLGWTSGTELNYETDGDKLTLWPTRKRRTKREEPKS